ncbi:MULTISPECIES: hypothetical protein [unclassified Chelatococcus]|uniref:hypothetical protein n=1 Tax=unclassified Chelatococcus TaxID=2638111 RepID=UPI001BCF6D0E|nr:MULTISPECIES: hypothetical protein [unclassified Chelatococcus]CAH1665434.1 conserved hypothetical protein [Hyphomicrobiales bacterium]MBS7737719.1 hypothetical protein [Chelatococcus sp. HY11]MBX3544147.1 hypothetical protein [Chelatococcus sp.]MCO5079183.1 hypothetical protein [Chelatococcus sp.]CAH1681345.1 conserved hypothetical protein [Hyphomicrobiales bacterium]
MSDPIEQAVEAAAAAFHMANKERNHLRWENCSEQYRREIRELIRPSAEAAFRVAIAGKE